MDGAVELEHRVTGGLVELAGAALVSELDGFGWVVRLEPRDHPPSSADREVIQPGEVAARRAFGVTHAHEETGGLFGDFERQRTERELFERTVAVGAHLDWHTGRERFDAAAPVK